MYCSAISSSDIEICFKAKLVSLLKNYNRHAVGNEFVAMKEKRCFKWPLKRQVNFKRAWYGNVLAVIFLKEPESVSCLMEG